MIKVACRVDDRQADPLFEVFDGGDFILSSYKDVEWDSTEISIYFPEKEKTGQAQRRLSEALAVVGADARIEVSEIRDEDWKLSYRRHFRTEKIGNRLLVVPSWETPDGSMAKGRVCVTLDPGMAFGTGKHETTKACLEYIDELSPDGGSFLDMGCGSGILSIAAAKLGFSPVAAFDIDPDAVESTLENCRLNNVDVDCREFSLGRGSIDLDGSIEAAKGLYPDLALKPRENAKTAVFKPADLVVANILGPLLVAFADEIALYVEKRIVISGILAVSFDETFDAFKRAGFSLVSKKVYGEWASALLERKAL